MAELFPILIKLFRTIPLSVIIIAIFCIIGFLFIKLTASKIILSISITVSLICAYNIYFFYFLFRLGRRRSFSVIQFMAYSILTVAALLLLIASLLDSDTFGSRVIIYSTVLMIFCFAPTAAIKQE